MEIDEYLIYRKELLAESADNDGFVQQNLFLSEVLPLMADARLIDSEECNDAYYTYPQDNLKINGYLVNESGERLQLFLVDESSIDLNATNENLKISTKVHYDTQFKRALRFVSQAVKGHLTEELQLSSPVRALATQLASGAGADQFDVIEIFLISATATVDNRGSFPQPRRLEFEDEKLSITFSHKRERTSKELLVLKSLIDLNFLYNVVISQGSREPLVIDFEKTFGYRVEALEAASEDNFESYLCVLPAIVLADLYKRYSSRLLEKNVRSFLQFKGANAGIRETIRKNPEKFIAYNNGITVTATHMDRITENGRIYIRSLRDFQIVNGGQTTASIFFTRKDGFSVDKVRVMAKINVARDVPENKLDELISNISKFSNSQSKVSSVDLDSRNPQLTRIKALSESIITPTGKRWFFEKAKGEFNTKLRIAGNNRNRIERDYPRDMRFSKEQLGKYFTSWGDQPYVVKKGGDKVFRYFIDAISGEDTLNKPEIDRAFYEMLIARVILFKSFENIYGQGKNSIGQIRSAVVPYSISVIYRYTDGQKGGRLFDLAKLWLREGIEEDLSEFARQLMELMNDLIRKYAASDDLGEYSKRKELWEGIRESTELSSFMNTQFATEILDKFTVPRGVAKEKAGKRNKTKEVDFGLLNANVTIFSRTADFYQKLGLKLADKITTAQRKKVDHIAHCIASKKDILPEYVEFEKELIRNVRTSWPDVLNSIDIPQQDHWMIAFYGIVSLYNRCVSEKLDVSSEFQKQRELAKVRGHKYYSVYDEIGKTLAGGQPPSIKFLENVNYFSQSVHKQ
ncbi:AIPR family protein [Mucilaginibacter daejeonensis]|uniref:AIPR family protein n=1 Tax=Mucilaginibacter daejeonensis TaxID=398049 RepID=UPI001D173C78|nr:AIPR family protein [Mucilaginibacter daejeonensis]UEG54911.1 AIPR family protein [Mucilaginibacter daejeonensis]